MCEVLWKRCTRLGVRFIVVHLWHRGNFFEKQMGYACLSEGTGEYNSGAGSITSGARPN